MRMMDNKGCGCGFTYNCSQIAFDMDLLLHKDDGRLLSIRKSLVLFVCVHGKEWTVSPRGHIGLTVRHILNNQCVVSATRGH